MGYEQLLAQDQYPAYFIFLDLDPSTIDVNVHPTKTEIKFDEENSSTITFGFCKTCPR